MNKRWKTLNFEGHRGRAGFVAIPEQFYSRRPNGSTYSERLWRLVDPSGQHLGNYLALGEATRMGNYLIDQAAASDKCGPNAG